MDEPNVLQLIRDIYWSRIRATLYKQICKGSDGYNQWAYIMGRKRTDSQRNKIRLSEKNIAFLEATVQYLNSTEGRDELLDMGIIYPPEHIDDLIDIIQGSMSDRQVKAEIFRLFLNNRHRLLRYLNNYYAR